MKLTKNIKLKNVGVCIIRPIDFAVTYKRIGRTQVNPGEFMHEFAIELFMVFNY